MQAINLKDKLSEIREKPIEVQPVDLPEYGGSVYVRVMSGTERDRFDSEIVRRKHLLGDKFTEGIRGLIVAATVCDANGALQFALDEAEIIGHVFPSPILNRIVNVARKLNAMGSDAVEEAKGNS